MTDDPTEDPAEEVDVVVAVGDDGLAHLDEVVEGLASQGLAVTGVQSTLGTLSGRVARSALPGLSAVAGVEAVEQARTFQLPPRDADVQGGDPSS
ncbi:MAG: hypothetical protein WD080_06185 [Egibacteraceae bacterium]